MCFNLQPFPSVLFSRCRGAVGSTIYLVPANILPQWRPIVQLACPALCRVVSVRLEWEPHEEAVTSGERAIQVH